MAPKRNSLQQASLSLLLSLLRLVYATSQQLLSSSCVLPSTHIGSVKLVQRSSPPCGRRRRRCQPCHDCRARQYTNGLSGGSKAASSCFGFPPGFFFFFFGLISYYIMVVVFPCVVGAVEVVVVAAASEAAKETVAFPFSTSKSSNCVTSHLGRQLFQQGDLLAFHFDFCYY